MNYNKKSVTDIDLHGKKVLLRCDFNVPMATGVITDDTRITASLPTIRYILDQGAAIILCSHLGRPKGEYIADQSLMPIAKRVSALLDRPVKMARRRTIPSLPASWHLLRTCLFLTPSAPVTARTPPRRAWPGICPRYAAFSSRPSSRA